MEYRFDVNSIKLEPITVEKKYPGTRFYFTAHMDTIAYNMSVDIGFGDVVTPYPTTIDFPLLLPDIPSVNIQAYSLETVVAEKFHTMIDRDVLNSRMKDFFDCYQLLTKRDLSDDTLYDDMMRLRRLSIIEGLHTIPNCSCLQKVLRQTQPA